MWKELFKKRVTNKITNKIITSSINFIIAVEKKELNCQKYSIIIFMAEKIDSGETKHAIKI